MPEPDAPFWTIGGSEAAAACGIDPYRSAVMLWLEKTGRVARHETEAMRWGRLVEPLIFASLQTDGRDVLPAPADGYKDPERPWLTGHPDGFVRLDGARGVLEIKTANQWARAQHDGDVPVHWQAQVQQYLHLTGLDVALVACLVNGQRLELATVERDEKAIGRLIELEEGFLWHVTTDKPPAPDGSDSAKQALRELFGEAQPGKTIRLLGEPWEAVKQARVLKEQIDECERQYAVQLQLVQAAMGDAEYAVSPFDTTVARWQNVSSSRLDMAALKTDHPRLYAEYTKTTASRRMTLI